MTTHEQAIVDEQMRAQLRVLVEAGVVCALCELPVENVDEAVAIKASDDAPSQLAHRSCEDGMAALVGAVNRFATQGHRAFRGSSSFPVVRTVRE